MGDRYKLNLLWWSSCSVYKYQIIMFCTCNKYVMCWFFLSFPLFLSLSIVCVCLCVCVCVWMMFSMDQVLFELLDTAWKRRQNPGSHGLCNPIAELFPLYSGLSSSSGISWREIFASVLFWKVVCTIFLRLLNWLHQWFKWSPFINSLKEHTVAAIGTWHHWSSS